MPRASLERSTLPAQTVDRFSLPSMFGSWPAADTNCTTGETRMVPSQMKSDLISASGEEAVRENLQAGKKGDSGRQNPEKLPRLTPGPSFLLGALFSALGKSY